MRGPATIAITNAIAISIAIAIDNDFGMRDGVDAGGHQNDTGVPTRLLVLRLPRTDQTQRVAQRPVHHVWRTAAPGQ